MDQLLNFIVMFVPAGLVLVHSLVESKHRSEQLRDMQKHNSIMLQMTTREMMGHLKTQDEVITSLRRQIDGI